MSHHIRTPTPQNPSHSSHLSLFLGRYRENAWNSPHQYILTSLGRIQRDAELATEVPSDSESSKKSHQRNIYRILKWLCDPEEMFRSVCHISSSKSSLSGLFVESVVFGWGGSQSLRTCKHVDQISETWTVCTSGQVTP